MEIRLNSSTPNTRYQVNYQKNNNKNKQNSVPAFTGDISKMYDNFCKSVGRNVCRRLYNNSFIDKVGSSLKDPDNAIKHFLAIGSFITSGMYMQRTLTNDKMDKDRRNTLAVNQGATFVISTLGAYLADDTLKEKWKGLHLKYLARTAEGRELLAGWEAKNADIAKNNEGIAKELQRPKLKIDEYIEQFGSTKVPNKQALKAIQERSKGFNALRQILVFGAIYRFFVPLLIVKPTNILCDKYLENKKKKAALSEQQKVINA